MTDTAPRFMSIVNNSFSYEAVRRQVLDQMEKDFITVEGFAKKAEKCKGIYMHQVQFVFEDWIKNENPDMALIRTMFTQIASWEELLGRSIDGRKTSGMI
jgi:hypothetical protein